MNKMLKLVKVCINNEIIKFFNRNHKKIRNKTQVEN